MTLNEFFAAHPKCALGFSGGVDSAYLLYAGVQAGADIRPYYIKTAFQPRFERDRPSWGLPDLRGAPMPIIKAVPCSFR